MALHLLLMSWIAVAGGQESSTVAASQDRAVEAVRRNVQQIVAGLDADRFDDRRRAAERLDALAAERNLGPILGAELRRLMHDPQTSFEVRSRLSTLLARLPQTVDEQPAHVSPTEVKRLIGQLESELYSEREGAAKRLLWLGSQTDAAAELLLPLRQRLAESQLSAETRRRIPPLLQRVRGTWLLSDPATWKLPPVSDTEIRQWVDDLAAPLPPNAVGSPRNEAARQMLVDTLARDEYVPRVRQALERRRSLGGLDLAADGRLTAVIDLTRPALVAEVWKRQTHVTIQHLLVDVPQMPEGALRASHFDRIDDLTAHVVSGSNLLPIEYPVGVGIPHPKLRGLMYHVVNLPTPRRRMAYDVSVQSDARKRLRELTDRTLGRAIDKKLYFNDQEAWLLEELDADTLSRRIGEYFLSVPDRPCENCEETLSSLAGSHHGRVCHVLASVGTKEIAPLFVAALKKKGCFLPPTQAAPYNWPWLAALMIADRDPWARVDDWLAGLLESNEMLRIRNEPPDDELLSIQGLYLPAGQIDLPELAASAAALLLERHFLAPQAFGIRAIDDPRMRSVCPTYRFESPQHRQKVVQWWQEQTRTARR